MTVLGEAVLRRRTEKRDADMQVLHELGRRDWNEGTGRWKTSRPTWS
jgi:hypothetical protein